MQVRFPSFLKIICVLCLALTFPGASLTEAASQKVLLVPFKIFSESDMSFLQKGVQSMLATRLAGGADLEIIELQPDDPALQGISGGLDEMAAADLAGRAGADFVAFGTITILGSGISTDARFFDVTAGETRVAFSSAGNSQGDAILHVNQFAERVNAEVFGKGAAPTQALAAAPQESQPASSRANPEAMWRREFGMGVSETPTGTEPPALLWKSGNYREEIRGIAVADIDGDGKNEVVLGGQKQLMIHRMEGNGFVRVAEIPIDRWITIINVEAADVNRNNIAEIFVSARNDKFKASSFVLEWDGSRFARVEENSSWYFRVVADPGTGTRRLFGQQGGMREALFGTVYEMDWAGGKYAPQQKQFVPSESNVFGFAVGDVLNNGEPAIVSFVKGDKLRISLANGREEWTSADAYGGSASYLFSPEEYVLAQRESRTEPDPQPFDKTWLSQRVIIADLNGDQKKEVLVVANHDQTGGLFARLRSFVKGRFECLEWDNVGLQPKWRTRYFTGYISDYDLADPDNDGRQELIFSVVKQVGDPITGRKVSYIVVWKPEAEVAEKQ
ncbi:MAG: FG-GAP repeat domain-containing protein [Desulfobacterales bacterium]